MTKESEETVNEEKKKKFRKLVLEWGKNGIRDYPWRQKKTPYRVLISEILLTRTKAEQVLPVYKEFIKTYPNIRSFLKMDLNLVEEIIKSLGLLFRAEMLKEIAIKLKNEFKGNIPNSLKELKSLKGIGDYGANAILCFGFGQKRPLIDANFIRIYLRVFGIKPKTKTAKNDKFLWQFAEKLLPDTKFIQYNYSILDLGGQICRARTQDCKICPVNDICLKRENEHLNQINSI